MEEHEEFSMYGNLENDFLQDLSETQRVILCLGMKGSGKTTLFNAYLKNALINQQYESYHLVIPTYKYEMSGSYNFLKNQYQCFIYPTYTPMVSQKVLNDRQKGLKTLFMIDDGSGFNMNDEKFKLLVTTSRHGKSKKNEAGGVCIFMCLHSARRVMLPIVRQNCDYIFIFSMNNRKLLESLFEEYFSMVFDKFHDFLEMYKKAMKEKYNAILYSNQNPTIDADVKSWSFVQEMMEIKELPTMGKAKQNKQNSEKKDEQTNKLKISQMFKPISFNKSIKFNH